MWHQSYHGKRVLITGHTGFKGSWLAFWLYRLGAEVCGYALPAPTDPSHWALLGLNIPSVEGDIRDADQLKSVVRTFRPDMVFHLAAQALVRRAYDVPIETFSTNVMGTLNVFEACRVSDTVRAIINVTSDKCYENREWVWGYRENEPMGGQDPYSASKGCAELLTRSYRHSYFNNETYGQKHHILLASCRAGNVIGGGDWGADRLVPDIMRATAQRQSAGIRNPRSVRPWQHVLESLSGYLKVGEKLMDGQIAYATAWNFGPSPEAGISVAQLVESLGTYWKKIKYHTVEDAEAPHENKQLRLDCSKAYTQLHWQPIWDIQKTIEKTVSWYKAYYKNGTIQTAADVKDYEQSMRCAHG